ncbi:MAG: GlsB/YeaQ/YmgE family stress response membrane protein [Methylovirgula sp.]
MHIIWIVIIGFVAGLIARFFSPAPNNPSGFVLTCLLGIAGAFLATFIGHEIGWYRLSQGAGLIGATLGAIILLVIWRAIVGNGAAGPDAGTGPRRWL